MIETYVATSLVVERIKNPAYTSVLSQFKILGTASDPIYPDSAPPNAPVPYVVIASIGQDDMLTQEKYVEYVDVELDVISTCEYDRVDTGPTGNVWLMAQYINIAITTPSEPVDVASPDGGVFIVTCDRLSARSFSTQDGGTLIRTVAARYLVRVQKKLS